MQGKPYAGNPHVRFLMRGKVALAATPRRGSLLYNGSRFMLHSVVLAVFTVFSAQSLFFRKRFVLASTAFGGESISDR